MVSPKNIEKISKSKWKLGPPPPKEKMFIPGQIQARNFRKDPRYRKVTF